MKFKDHPITRILILIGLLYIFLLSVSLMGASFKLMSKTLLINGMSLTELLKASTSNPIMGLLIGILVTSLIQSSSTTTSMTVLLVASDAITFNGAIYLIMGANVGTSVTNTLVSLAHIGRSEEFKRAFAASTVHDFFNVLAIIVIMPIQYFTNFLGISATYLGGVFQSMGGLKFSSPIKLITKPVVAIISDFIGNNGVIMVILALVLLFIALRYIVVVLKGMVIGKVEAYFNEKMFKTDARALFIGLVLTVMVQSSSITTSLAVPLAGAAILTLRQIFPFTLGANIGTTVTSMLAALATGNITAVSTSFAHFLFNIFGILFIWPLKRIPIRLAENLAEIAVKNKIIPIVYIITLFFLIPLSFILLTG